MDAARQGASTNAQLSKINSVTYQNLTKASFPLYFEPCLKTVVSLFERLPFHSRSTISSNGASLLLQSSKLVGTFKLLVLCTKSAVASRTMLTVTLRYGKRFIDAF